MTLNHFTMTPSIFSIQIGLPRTIDTPQASDTRDRQWFSSIYKDPVHGRVWMGQTNLNGDAQADLRVHGGMDKAVYAYPSEHYPGWKIDLQVDQLPHGGFGENLTTLGLTEENVCIGDEFSIGQARVQVSEPRGPCWKLARRIGTKAVVALMERSGRTGWYLRVLAEGWIEAGMYMVLEQRPAPDWSIARVNQVFRDPFADLEAALTLTHCEHLAKASRSSLMRRIDRKTI